MGHPTIYNRLACGRRIRKLAGEKRWQKSQMSVMRESQ